MMEMRFRHPAGIKEVSLNKALGGRLAVDRTKLRAEDEAIEASVMQDTGGYMMNNG
jgi:hypothetical protein